METEERILECLREAGFRRTRARTAVIRTLVESEDWLRPEELQARGQRYCPSLGLVTVYRSLNLLSELGFVRRVHFDDGCHGYARSELAHGHHLVCRICQQVVEFPGSKDLSPLMRRIERETGFEIEDHMLELIGVCPACQQEREGAP